MNKGMILLIAIALMAPLTLMAQDGTPGRALCPQGDGPGHRMMGQGHPGFDCDGPGPMGGKRGHGRKGGGIGHLLMLGDKIDLTDAQRDQLKEMQTAFKLDQIDAKAEMEKAQLRLRNLQRDDDASESDVFRAIDETSRLKAEMRKTAYSHRKQVHAVLTDTQIEKLKELRQTCGEGMGPKDGCRPMMGRGGRGGRHGG